MQALDRGASILEADKIVTGHNADDIAETVRESAKRGGERKGEERQEE